MLAADANALLARGRPLIAARLLTGEHVLELDHAGVVEHERRIVRRNERRARDDLVLTLCEGSRGRRRESDWWMSHGRGRSRSADGALTDCAPVSTARRATKLPIERGVPGRNQRCGMVFLYAGRATFAQLGA